MLPRFSGFLSSLSSVTPLHLFFLSIYRMDFFLILLSLPIFRSDGAVFLAFHFHSRSWWESASHPCISNTGSVFLECCRDLADFFLPYHRSRHSTSFFAIYRPFFSSFLSLPSFRSDGAVVFIFFKFSIPGENRLPRPAAAVLRAGVVTNAAANGKGRGWGWGWGQGEWN